MAAPFYLLFLPLFLVIAMLIWAFYARVVRDSQSDLRTHGKSDLEIAQELERQEDAAEHKS